MTTIQKRISQLRERIGTKQQLPGDKAQLAALQRLMASGSEKPGGVCKPAIVECSAWSKKKDA